MVRDSESHDPSTIARKADQLLDDPIAFANYRRDNWDSRPREELAAIQLRGLQRRFAEFRERIPVLKRLADGEGIDRIDAVDDAVPLLFEHTVYKSYPPSLLEKANFAQINRWIAKLVLPEVGERIAAVDVSACRGLDDWFETMDAALPDIRISHTSGTSGRLCCKNREA